VATAVILLYLYPSIVTIASIFLLGEKLTPQKLVALPLTFIGCVLVAGAQDLGEGIPIDIIGIALGLYTAFSGRSITCGERSSWTSTRRTRSFST